jgi:flagellar motor protein MotB
MPARFEALALAFLVAAVPSRAPAEEEPDVEGSRDHPAVKRYPGSTITSFDEREFEAYPIPVSSSALEKVEGKLHRATYRFPVTASCTQILRNYEQAFRAAGLQVFRGSSLPDGMDVDVNGDRFVTGIGPARGGGKVYVTQFCGSDDPGFNPLGDLVVVETRAMAQKVEVTAEFLAGEIARNGRVAVYGILFATGKADVTPDSARTLAQIGELLASHPDWRLRIEGHTDDVGGAKQNLELSRRRADSVKQWLASRHGVAPARLETQGFGDTQPLAPNTTDEARARNRRVELVKL